MIDQSRAIDNRRFVRTLKPLPRTILREVEEKLRGIRKRNGLTLEELSARCVQRSPEHAPSVSYLSLIESGKRSPSREVLELLGQVFRREPRRAVQAIQLGRDVKAAARYYLTRS